MDRIGYQQLTSEEKKAYDRFLHTFERYGTDVDLSDISTDVDIMKVMQTVLGDHPQVIYFNRGELAVSASLFGGKKVHLRGALSPSQARSMQQQLDAALMQAVSDIEALCPSSNYEKLMLIYEYLQDRLSYDTQELEAFCQNGRGIRPMSHNAYGAMVNHLGVCDGISSAFTLIAQKIGFACSMVHGKATFMTQGFSGHGWNIIKIGSFYYHLDLTWDVNHKDVTGEYSYEYFCATDTDISRDHDWDTAVTPKCSREDLSFYVRNRCVANNLTQLEEIFARYAKSKQKVVRVKIAEGIAIPEPAKDFLGKKLLEIAASVGRYSRLAFTWNSDTRCFYARFDS